MRGRVLIVLGTLISMVAGGCAAPPAGVGVPASARDIRVAPSPPAGPSHREVTWRRIESTIVFLDYRGEAMIPEPTVEHSLRVRVGEPLRVTIRSFGGGCEAAGGLDGAVQGLTAELRPWDYTHAPSGPAGLEYVCTTPLNVFKRTATLVFDQPGRATIRVHGLRSHGREPGHPPVVLTSTVAVEP